MTRIVKSLSFSLTDWDLLTPGEQTGRDFTKNFRKMLLACRGDPADYSLKEVVGLHNMLQDRVMNLKEYIADEMKRQQKLKNVLKVE